MYVCICKAVSDKTIKRAMADGACSVGELRERLGVATGCGRCVPEIRCMLAQAAVAAPIDLPASSLQACAG
jgi:bacterioferritin-associated ferredoxin